MAMIKVMGVLGVDALRQGLLPDRELKAKLKDIGQSKLSGVCEGFFGRKLCVSTPTTTTPAGVVTLLRAPLWLPSLH
jgi:hypothetical protein